MSRRSSGFFLALTLVGSAAFSVGVGAPAARATALAPFIDLTEVGLTLKTGSVGLEDWAGGPANLTVDIGGTVRFALLYWAGRQENCAIASGECAPTQPYNDQQITFDGIWTITGTVIGTETQTVSGNGSGPPILNIGYFADVTSVVAAAGTGTKSFALADGDSASNLTHLLGASLVVAYADAANPNAYRVQVWDNLDFADGDDPTAGATRTTSSVSFAHGAVASARNAELYVIAGGGTADGPDNVTISNNPTLVNSLTGESGASWDTRKQLISIPANINTTTVQVNSAPAGSNPDALLWEAAALRTSADPAAPLSDITAPSCNVVDDDGPPRTHTMSVQDSGSGLASVLVTQSENADTVVPPFTVGTVDPVVVTSTVIDQSQPDHETVVITDVAGNVKTCDVTGSPATPTTPSITGNPPAGWQNNPYSFQFTLGGSPAPTTTVTAGSLPPGLSLDTSGLLSGTPTVPGTYHFTVTADNGSVTPATKDVTLSIRAIAVAIKDTSRAEGNAGLAPMSFRVVLNHKSGFAVTVRWSTADGSATTPSDYVAASGTLTFNPGQTAKVINVQIKGDHVREPGETLFVTLFSPTGARISDAAAVGVIRNDD